MQFRKFGKLEGVVSALGFGCMRLPTTDGKPMSPRIDEGEAIRMIRHAIDRGVNYVDTAYPYHDGQSEVVVGKALKDGYRDKVQLVTKSPIWLIKGPKDFDKYLAEQLVRLGTDHVDGYLLHGLDKSRFESIVLKHGLLERSERAIADGRIRYIGFSFHDKPECFKPIVDGYDKWAFCLIQHNYMDTENQAGTAGLRYAASRGLAVIIMEPLLGGKLANPPQPIRDIFDRVAPGRSPADLALQWLWDQPEVSAVLSGMTTMKQLEENLASAEMSGVGAIVESDRNLIATVREEYRRRMPIPCTKCGYCVPCPNGVDIPQNLELYNDGVIHDDFGFARFAYARFMSEKERASACDACKTCEELCPQKIEISTWMPIVHGTLGDGKAI